MNKLCVLVFLALAACSATGPQYNSMQTSISAVNPSKSRIVVYRPHAWLGLAGWYEVDINGKTVCDIHDSSFFIYDIDPGDSTVSSSLWHSPGTSRLTLKTSRGHIYYIKIIQNADKEMIGLTGGLLGQLASEATSENKGPFLINLVNKDDALKVVADLKMEQSCK